MFTLRELENLANDAGLSGAHSSISRKQISKKERREIISSSANLDDKKICAAIEIQRSWRGYKTRSMLFEVLHPNKSLSTNDGSRLTKDLSTISTFSNTKLQLSNSGSGNNLSAKCSSKVYKSYDSYKEIATSQRDIPVPFQEFCATVIQRWWKNIKLEKREPKTPSATYQEYEASSRTSFDDNIVQKSRMAVSLMRTPSGLSVRSASEEVAASIIQKSWRRHIDMQVYKYYKDLINFKCEGDPALMLKCINPLESSLLDSAAGVHVRFRLGGDQFPPNIYYKVFTSRNIADIGSFAPRDYTKPNSKKLPMKHIHNKGGALNAKNASDTGWYERWENNGWRPVSDKVLRHIYQDPVTYRTSKKTIAFHHSKLVRKVDFAKRQKAKKIAWMKKMYREGALKVQGQDSNLKSFVQTAAQDMTHTSQTQLHESVEDWEVDELLEWTNGLNFDEYSTEWKELGTTVKTNTTEIGAS